MRMGSACCSAGVQPPTCESARSPPTRHLQQLVLLRLVRERGSVQRLERLARAQRVAQTHFVIAEQSRCAAVRPR